MARLTAAARRNLKPSQFAGPGRSYPVNDHTHAEQAKRFAKRNLNRGRISRAQYDRIVAKADKAEGKSPLRRAFGL